MITVMDKGEYFTFFARARIIVTIKKNTLSCPSQIIVAGIGPLTEQRLVLSHRFSMGFRDWVHRIMDHHSIQARSYFALGIPVVYDHSPI